MPGFNPSSLLISYVILSKMLNFSVPRFPHLYNGPNNSTPPLKVYVKMK